MLSSRRTPTHRLRRQCLVLVAGAALTGLTACSGVQGGSGGSADSGEGFPTKAVEITAPMSPGGSTDLITRALAKSAEKPLGQSVVVVNKEGANGAVGGKEVLGSPPDGYNWSCCRSRCSQSAHCWRTTPTRSTSPTWRTSRE